MFLNFLYLKASFNIILWQKKGKFNFNLKNGLENTDILEHCFEKHRSIQIPFFLLPVTLKYGL